MYLPRTQLTYNVSRSGHEADSLRQTLFNLGASEVVTEDFAGSHSMKELMEVRRCPQMWHILTH